MPKNTKQHNRTWKPTNQWMQTNQWRPTNQWKAYALLINMVLVHPVIFLQNIMEYSIFKKLEQN